MSAERVRKIKVKPYPIEVLVNTATGPKSVAIVKLATKGFIADVKDLLFKVGEEATVHGELPADYGALYGGVRVIKTYDQFQGADHHLQRLVEFHLIRPEEEMVKRIHQFLQKIRQLG